MPDAKSEAGTAQHKKKAQAQGDGVRSRELLSAVSMLAGLMVMSSLSGNFVRIWRMVLERCLTAATLSQPFHELRWTILLHQLIRPAMNPVLSVMMASFVGALSVGIAQGGGLQIHPAALALKFSKLNPVSNLGNLFTLRAAIRVLKSLVPAAAMVIFGWTALKKLMLPMPVLSLMRLPNAMDLAFGLAFDAAWVTLAWSGLDYAVEWVSWNNRMKMTKQELRDEMRDTMGNPQVKGRIRQAQNMIRRRKVKADISRATVVITNPTHYAIALLFSFETMSAPTVLAKGRDLHAAEIREEARWAGVPLIENAPLARSLYRAVEPGQTIPFELYAAVAGILAYLYRQKAEERMREERERARRVVAPVVA